MSSYEEGDARRTSRSRRTGPRTLTADEQALRNRRLVAGGAGLVVLLVLVLGIRSCVSSARQSALRAYSRNVGQLAQTSHDQVAVPLFGLLTSGAQPIELESRTDDLRANADALVRRAEGLSAPGGLTEAQRDLVLVFVLRRDAIGRIASQLRDALSSQAAATAIPQIAGQMEAFLASDVLYSQRVVPLVRVGLDSGGLKGAPAPSADVRFLEDLGWLSTGYVDQKIGASPLPGSSNPSGPVAPGSHGHGLTSVSVGKTQLQTGSPTTIPSGAGTDVTVKFQNQGTNDEKNVGVKVTVTGSGAPIVLQKSVPATVAGQSATADLPFTTAPPSGVPLTLKVEILPVPGEKNVSNNSGSYSAIFSK